MNLNEEQVIAFELNDSDLKNVVGGWRGEHDDNDWGHHRWRHNDRDTGGYPFFGYGGPSCFGGPSFEGGPSCLVNHLSRVTHPVSVDRLSRVAHPSRVDQDATGRRICLPYLFSRDIISHLDINNFKNDFP